MQDIIQPIIIPQFMFMFMDDKAPPHRACVVTSQASATMWPPELLSLQKSGSIRFIRLLSSAYLGSGCKGSRLRRVFQISLSQQNFPAPLGGSRGSPRPDEIYSSSSKFWVCPGVSSQLALPSTNFHGTLEASRWMYSGQKQMTETMKKKIHLRFDT